LRGSSCAVTRGRRGWQNKNRDGEDFLDITPDKKRLLDLVERAGSGEVALPEFQRNFVWTRDDV